MDFINEKLYIVLRGGLKDKVSEVFNVEMKYIDNDKKSYKKKELMELSIESRSLFIILCRDINIKLDFFRELIRFAFAKKSNILMVDIYGNRKEIGLINIFKYEYKVRKKEYKKKAVDFLFAVYKPAVFFISIVLILLFYPFIIIYTFFRRKILNKKYRVAIAKRVHSNQSYIVSKGLRELGYFVITYDLVGHPFNYQDCDIQFPLTKKNIFAIFFYLNLFFIYGILRSDLYLFENNGESFFVSPLFKDWKIEYIYQIIELKIYKLLLKKVIFEIRDCTIYNKQEALKWKERNMCRFCNAKRESVLCGNKRYVGNNKIAVKYADKILYSTPDLRRFLPKNSEWFPNGYIYDGGDKIKSDNKKLIIIHASTSIEMKGTDFVIEAIDKLKKEFDIEFKLLRNIPHKKIINYIIDADIVLDQFNYGGYGNFGIESMINGKPVIGYISDDFFNIYPKELPIINVETDDIVNGIYKKTRELILDKNLRKKTGLKSKEYALKIHSYKVVAKRLSNIINKI